MQNPNSIPLRTTGEKEISEARRTHFQEMFSDYANVLGNFTSEAQAVEPFKFMNRMVGIFIYQVMHTRAAVEANPKAKHHFYEFAQNLMKREEKHEIHPLDHEKFHFDEYLVVKTYEQAKVNALFQDLFQEKTLDPTADEVLFWVDFFEALKAELKGVAEHIDYLFNRQRLELVFHRIERGVQYDG